MLFFYKIVSTHSFISVTFVKQTKLELNPSVTFVKQTKLELDPLGFSLTVFTPTEIVLLRGIKLKLVRLRCRDDFCT